jgi:phage repressor protein C with HTH and peptisase S24 domain
VAEDPIKFNPNDTQESVQPKMTPELGGCAEKEPYALQVLGADMEPEFPDKCIIVIEPFNRPLDGAYVVAEVEGEKWFRQFREDESGRQYLAACNDIYPDIELNHLDWQIVGIIRQRNIRRDIKHYEYPGE